MKICFFGIYNPAYSRNSVLRRAFEKNGWEVVDCRVDPREYKGLSKYRPLVRQWKTSGGKECDKLLVCYPGHSMVWLARLLYGKPVIFDAFLSLYDSNVFDRKIYSRLNPRAWYDWFLDYMSCHIASKVLLDTNEHIEYFVKEFHLSKEKFIRVLIGADESIFYPKETVLPDDTKIVHFHGMFIPLQGTRYIIEAAEILRDKSIFFRLVGSGQEYQTMRLLAEEKGLKNIEFTGRKSLEEVADFIAASHVCLGIFGETRKAMRVIPNKVYEYAAMGKPIITAESPAIKEVFTDGADVILCKPASGSEMAKAIEKVLAKKDMAQKLGASTRRTFEAKMTAEILGKELIQQL